MRLRTRLLAIIFSVTLVLPASAAFAGGHHGGGGGGEPTLSDPLVSGLAGPLQIAVDDDTVYVAQSFAGVLTIVSDDGRTDLPVPNLDGIDASHGRVLFTTRADAPPGVPPDFATLNRLKRDGSSTQIADLMAYEETANPDQVNTYGFESIPDDCAAQLPPELGPPTYSGQPDSNPFAVAITRHGAYVADSGANAILSVSKRGRIRTVAVLPPQPATITPEAVAGLGLPDCTLGLTYLFEPVPTDVEVGHGGQLYVSTLPGGPEGPELGARGSVWRINPRTGQAKMLGSGFLGATALALGPHGIYVSEIFAGQVSKLGRHGPEPLVQLAPPAGLEYADGKLYVAYDVFGNGSVATISLGEHGKRGHD